MDPAEADEGHSQSQERFVAHYVLLLMEVARTRKLFMMAGLARPVNFMQEGGATVPPARKPALPKAE
jgi:hypothetical protein